MRPFPFALVALLLLSAVPARADILAETAYDYGVRSIYSDYLPPYPPTSVSLDDKSPALVATLETDSVSGFDADVGLKFALGSALPFGASITSATLTLAVTRTDHLFGEVSGPDPVLTVSGSGASSGGLMLADFISPYASTMPNVGSDVLPQFVGTTYPGPTPVIVTFDVTSLLGSILAVGSSSAMFQLDEYAVGNDIDFGGPSDATATNRPILSITYAAAVPEPASALLCEIGLGGAIIAARAARSPR